MCGEMSLADIQIRDTSKIAGCRMRNADLDQILFLLIQAHIFILKSEIRIWDRVGRENEFETEDSNFDCQTRPRWT